MWITEQEMGKSWMIIKFQTQYCPIPGGEWEQRLKGCLYRAPCTHLSLHLFLHRTKTKHSDPESHSTISLNTVQLSLFIYSSCCLRKGWSCALQLTDTFQVHRCGTVLGQMHARLYWDFRWCSAATSQQEGPGCLCAHIVYAWVSLGCSGFLPESKGTRVSLTNESKLTLDVSECVWMVVSLCVALWGSGDLSRVYSGSRPATAGIGTNPARIRGIGNEWMMINYSVWNLVSRL